MLRKSLKLVEPVEMSIPLAAIHTQILVRELIPKSGQWRRLAREVRREHSDLPLTTNGFVVVLWFRRPLNGNGAVTDVDTALSCPLEISLHDIPQIGGVLKRRPTLLLKGT